MNRRSRALLSALLVLALATAGCGRTADAHKLYHCPMHPDYVSDRPGDCPICGMRLVPIEDANRPAGQDEGTAAAPAKTAQAPAPGPGAEPRAEATVYTCPMHPEVRQNGPGSCPKCGMDLEPELPAPASAVQALGHEAHQAGGTAAAGGTISLTADQARLAGVRTIAVTHGEIAGGIRAVGAVEADETRIRQITTKVAGFVEKLYVAAVGQLVRAGEPLFELYSPELLASQEEYLRARKTAERFAQSSLPEVRQGGAELAATARRRLELFDVPPEFLDHLDRTGTAERRVVFRAPFGGHVTAKTVLEGQRIEPGMPLITVSDLSRIWVTAQVYEAEAPAARVGRPARVTLPYEPSVTLRGRVAYVYPTLDVETRTLKVRLEFDNPRLTLKPGMFVNVDLSARAEQGLVVPDSAVLESGTRTVVFVERAPGQFEPRDVATGVRADGRVMVRSGLSEGERVAVAANFLLDSESRLRHAIGMAAAAKRERP